MGTYYRAAKNFGWTPSQLDNEDYVDVLKILMLDVFVTEREQRDLLG